MYIFWIRSKYGLTLDVKPYLVYNNMNYDLSYGYGKRPVQFPDNTWDQGNIPDHLRLIDEKNNNSYARCQ